MTAENADALPEQLALAVTLARMEEVEVAARRYIKALRLTEGADPGDLLLSIVERDWALHELMLAAGEECSCDPGTCPGRDVPRVSGRRVQDTAPL